MPTRFNDQINDDFGLDGNDEMWELLNVYADGEASPAEAARVEELLRSDASYARRFTFVKTTTVAVQSFTELDPPVSLRNAILASTSQRVTSATRLLGFRDTVRRLFAPQFAMSLAGLAAAGLLAFMVIGRNSQSPGNSKTPNSAANSDWLASSISGEGLRDLTANVYPTLDLPTNAPPTASESYRPRQSPIRTEVANVMSRLSDTNHSIAKMTMRTFNSRPSQPRRDDSQQTVALVAYQPDKDAQFERKPGSPAPPESQPVEIPGDDVHIADSDATGGPAPVHMGTGGTASVTAMTVAQNDGPHIIVAKLTALPPDPNQVLTKADMARNRAVFTSGYDRPTLKSIERKEASISILRGTF